MDAKALAAGLEDRFEGDLIADVPLSGYTTYRIGGPADLLAIPANLADLRHLLEAVAAEGADLLVLGRGSNVLVSDRGFRGVAVIFGRGVDRMMKKNNRTVDVESGCDLNRLVSWAIAGGLGGLEDLSGIPGSVGGAVRMNAGAMGASIGDRVERISVFTLAEGGVEERELEAAEAGFAYRRTALGDGDVICSVTMGFDESDRDALASRRKEVLEWRRENQPLGQPSAGSVFRNPEGVAAGALIERCGLKGLRVGDAVVSEKHANFIVNLGGASADDVYALIQRIKEEVARTEGIELEEEIKLVGGIGRGE
jgi:UDP-N-acetylmuramate dehydrogenase